ncbi:YdhK family protein [Paraliobacillus sediminis]|uniref:YdhK family protein n=1 Tax=Paraliobacillus sediminis TaxID=1885916 RepID=UPI000E3C5BB4|nr:YdhK family protein [Paraliobacillus sediminis]
MNRIKIILAIVSLFAVFIVSACTNEPNDTDSEESMEQATEDNTEGSHSSMNHSGSGEIPDGLEESENPTYEVGSKAIIEADHMEGMKGSEATIASAFDTTVYTVSYTPTTGGEPVENHKWVIHEELEAPGDAPLETGTDVILNADHMDGMMNAKATIDSAEETTVYMVNYVPITGGEKVTNHKWITESELVSIE